MTSKDKEVWLVEEQLESHWSLIGACASEKVADLYIKVLPIILPKRKTLRKRKTRLIRRVGIEIQYEQSREE